MKNCTSTCPCSYRTLGSGTIGYGCSYEGYCDFQLPRDSRTYSHSHSDFILKSIEDKCLCAGQEGNDGNCLFCHKPKRQGVTMTPQAREELE